MTENTEATYEERQEAVANRIIDAIERLIPADVQVLPNRVYEPLMLALQQAVFLRYELNRHRKEPG